MMINSFSRLGTATKRGQSSSECHSPAEPNPRHIQHPASSSSQQQPAAASSSTTHHSYSLLPSLLALAGWLAPPVASRRGGEGQDFVDIHDEKNSVPIVPYDPRQLPSERLGSSSSPCACLPASAEAAAAAAAAAQHSSSERARRWSPDEKPAQPTSLSLTPSSSRRGPPHACLLTFSRNNLHKSS